MRVASRAIAASLGAIVAVASQGLETRIQYIPFANARPLLDWLATAGASSLPAFEGQPEVGWDAWVRERDSEIRARLERGDEDTLVNWLLFGTSFTRQPRVTSALLESLLAQGQGGEEGQKQVSGILVIRSRDLIRALANPGSDERRLFARELLRRKGYAPGKPADEPRLMAYFQQNLARVFSEQAQHRRLLEDAHRLESRTEEFAARSRLYRDRGLSLDTTVLPNFALEESLRELKEQGLVSGGGVRRVGIIGPGLDFADKDAGYDVFPQQTIQPFAVMDSLLRLGLAEPGQLQVVTLDISPRVNHHVQRLRARAQQGTGYTLQLLRDPEEKWSAEAAGYWQRLGEKIGAPTKPASLDATTGELQARAVRVRAEMARRVRAADLNVVLQRLEGEKFDLLIATNILIYYDTFEQSLALANAAAMLRSGGLLLSNNALLELPVVPMRSVGYRTTVYSDRPDHGDHIVWYQKNP